MRSGRPVIQVLWRVPDTPGQKSRTPALIVVWWASFFLMNIVDVLSSESPGRVDVDATDSAMGFVTSLLALQVVRLFSARQEETARLLHLGMIYAVGKSTGVLNYPCRKWLRLAPLPLDPKGTCIMSSLHKAGLGLTSRESGPSP